MEIRTGDIVGDYRVMDAIGSGGMGAVFKVEHLITKRVEAMKALSTGFGIAPGEVRRFEREIQVQARLQHPNIAALYSAVRHGDVLALVMEYVEGESLQQALERGPLPLDVALGIAADVLAALDFAHRNGVVHGDVSPANIVVTAAGRAKLTDFGLARDGSSERLSPSGVPVGTAWYMSPEQVKGGDTIDARTDIYSTAAVLHEMLTGRKLFDADSAFAIMRCHVEAVPRPPGAFRRRVPAAIDSIVARALAKEPAARVQSAAEFRAAILRVTAGRRSKRWVFMAVAAVAFASMAWTAVIRSKGVHAGSAAPPPAPIVSTAPPVTAEPSAAPADEPNPAPPVEPSPARPVERTAAAHRSEPEPPMPKPTTRRFATMPPPIIPTAAPTAVASKRVTESPASPVPADVEPLPVIPHPAAVAPPPIAIPKPEEPKAQKSGNRFVRALGKINPFRRSSKADTPDAKDQ